MKIKNITPEQKRIAIAEKCGWKNIHASCNGESLYGTHPRWTKEALSERLKTEVKEDCMGHLVPDYLNDLNAMKDAEAVLTNDQRRYYAKMLVSVHPLKYSPIGEVDDAWMKLFMIASMTAAQRADAFLLTIG